MFLTPDLDVVSTKPAGGGGFLVPLPSVGPRETLTSAPPLRVPLLLLPPRLLIFGPRPIIFGPRPISFPLRRPPPHQLPEHNLEDDVAGVRGAVDGTLEGK